MSEISLEKIDILRERTGVTYTEAKEALEACDGNVVDALIYIEKNAHTVKEDIYTTTESFYSWLKDIIKKGNVSRIKIKKDEKVLVDVPVNAGIATGVLALLWTPLMAILGIGAVAAVITKLTIEITKTDGTVEVVNKIVKSGASKVKDGFSNFTSDMKDKYEHKDGKEKDDNNVYQYTVKFEEENEDKDK